MAGAFLVTALVIIGAAPAPRAAPEARWDQLLTTPILVANRDPFDIEAAVISTGTTATDPVWLVISWRPEGAGVNPDAVGQFVSCVPDDCRYRDDVAAGTTTVWWPGLRPGERRALTLTVAVSGIDAGGTFRYRVVSGVGADERSLGGGRTWTLDPDVG